MVNGDVEERADAAREDLKGIDKLSPERLPGGKIIAQLQPAPAGEQAAQDDALRRRGIALHAQHAEEVADPVGMRQAVV